MSKLKRNIIKCKHCEDIIESLHRHDFKWCKCGKVAVDGGTDYGKRSFPNHPCEDHIEDLSEYEEVVAEEKRDISYRTAVEITAATKGDIDKLLEEIRELLMAEDIYQNFYINDIITDSL